MSFDTFCNICFTKESIIKLCVEENETILNILISFTSCPDVVNGIIYLCINCCNKLEKFDYFRELCLTNFVRFRYLYKEYKKQLEIRNAPDIEIQLKAFVDVNVERPSGTPLIENYEAAQALRNSTCKVDITYKNESDGELTKIDFDELLNQNNLSHADISFSPENEDQEIKGNSVVKNEPNQDRFEELQDQLVCDRVAKVSPCHEKADDETSNVTFHSENCGTNDRFEESQDPLGCDRVVKASPCHESANNVTSNVSFTKIRLDELLNQNDLRHADSSFITKNENQEINGSSVVVKNEPNQDRFEESQDQLVCDRVDKASPCHESADDTSDVPFNTEDCVTDDSTDEEGSTESENKTKTSDSVCNGCNKSLPCDKCHTTFTDTAKIHKRLHGDERPYKCDECGSGFTLRSRLKIHRRMHTGEKPYMCDECGAKFSQGTHLKTHKRIHSGEKPYKCDECDSKFAERFRLNTHKLIHTGEKPYKCNECGWGFTRVSNLKSHKRIHTGEKPYKCDECDYRCTQRFTLITHKRIHTDEKPYKCDECALGFRQLSNLKSHKRTHTGEKPYNCDECGSTFSQSSHLNRHKLLHTSERPYKCDECGYRCTRRYDLQTHKRIHTGEKPYKCDECGSTFALRAYLRRHKLRHADKKSFSCD